MTRTKEHASKALKETRAALLTLELSCGCERVIEEGHSVGCPGFQLQKAMTRLYLAVQSMETR